MSATLPRVMVIRAVNALTQFQATMYEYRFGFVADLELGNIFHGVLRL